jgi:hypothetical protein
MDVKSLHDPACDHFKRAVTPCCMLTQAAESIQNDMDLVAPDKEMDDSCSQACTLNGWRMAHEWAKDIAAASVTPVQRADDSTSLIILHSLTAQILDHITMNSHARVVCTDFASSFPL